MAKTFSLWRGEPLLDIASYARRGPAGDRLPPEQLEHVRRTVRRVPEAVVKVLPRGSNDLKSAGKHLDYIGRYGELELEGDDGERLQGRIGKALLEDWDLDIDDVRRQPGLAAASGREPPKLIHKLMFSMPPGTPSDKVLAAVRNFAREEFALQHRYAFVLHTDEPHPHVHLMLKAVSEQGVRLSIKKATLRHWRSEFARHLRAVGVAANSTERAVRGESRSWKKDGIYRAHRRGESTYMQRLAEFSMNRTNSSRDPVATGKHRLNETREQVVYGWLRVAAELKTHGQRGLADEVRQFIAEMPSTRTDRELAAAELPHKGPPEPKRALEQVR